MHDGDFFRIVHSRDGGWFDAHQCDESFGKKLGQFYTDTRQLVSIGWGVYARAL